MSTSRVQSRVQSEVRKTVRTETCQECHWEVPIGAYHPHLHCTLAKFYGRDPAQLLAEHGYTRTPTT